jgi:hypothetical protein
MKIHERVSDKLDPWQQEQYSKWFYFQDDYDCAEDENTKQFLFDTIYNKEYQKKMDLWSSKDYLEFRDTLIQKTFATIYFGELIDRLADWNIKFSSI